MNDPEIPLEALRHLSRVRRQEANDARELARKLALVLAISLAINAVVIVRFTFLFGYQGWWR